MYNSKTKSNRIDIELYRVSENNSGLNAICDWELWFTVDQNRCHFYKHFFTISISFRIFLSFFFKNFFDLITNCISFSNRCIYFLSLQFIFFQPSAQYLTNERHHQKKTFKKKNSQTIVQTSKQKMSLDTKSVPNFEQLTNNQLHINMNNFVYSLFFLLILKINF